MIVLYMCRHVTKRSVQLPKPLPYKVLDSASPLEQWDKDYITTFLIKNGVEKDNYGACKVADASTSLDIPDLSDLASATIASIFKGKTVDEMREVFNIQNDFTPEEIEEITKDDKWLS
jgi:S-phase kinase-associated protein 1